MKVIAWSKSWFGRGVDYLRTSWWVTPIACVLAAMLASWGLERFDAKLSSGRTAWYLFRGGADGARAVLSTVATSMLTFAGVVFSVTMLVLQLASTQFSPRVLRTFLEDRESQLALGTFVATFVYALLGLRDVRSGSGGATYVPSFTVWFAVVLAVASVGAFIIFIHHVAQMIRAVVLIRRVGDETRATMSRSYGEGLGPEPDDSFEPVTPPTLDLRHTGAPGVVASVSVRSLAASAREANVTIRVLPRAGDFIAYGTPIVEIYGPPDAVAVDEVLAAIAIRPERSVHDDIGIGFRELVDIAERALSPGINDPSTAVQVIDELHDLLRRLVTRRFPAAVVRDRGRVLVVLRPTTFDLLVRLAIDEIRQCGHGFVQVLARLRYLVDDVLSIAPPSRRRELLAQRSLLETAADRSAPDARDRSVAVTPNPQG